MGGCRIWKGVGYGRVWDAGGCRIREGCRRVVVKVVMKRRVS